MEMVPGLLEQSSSPSLAVAVLAGGQSSRMGRDKALLPYPVGGSLLDQACAIGRELLLNLGQSPNLVFISGSYPDHRSVRDLLPGHGPLGGIHALLQYSLTQLPDVRYVLFLPVDMPDLSPATLRRLVDALQIEEAAVKAVHFQGFELPLLIEVAEATIQLVASRLNADAEARGRSIKELLLALNAQSLDPSDSDRAQFANVNNPEDYEALRRRASR